MGNEIEKYLLGKLNDLIKQVNLAEKPLPSQISNLPAKFSRLKNILEKELKSPVSLSLDAEPRISREKLYNLNNLLSEWQAKQISPFMPESMYFAVKCSLDLDSILDDLEKQDDKSTKHGEHQSQPLPESNGDSSLVDFDKEEAYRWSNQYVDEEHILGTKDNEVFLRRLILPQPLEEDVAAFRKFGLVGMRGIGKTTLAQMVFNHPDIRNHYLPRVWVCVSKQPYDDSDPRKEIVKRILRSLGVEDEIISYADTKHQLKGLLYALRLQLLGKRYLIVLDDVYVEDKDYSGFISNLEKDINKCEEKLVYAFPKDYGGAIIVTSRSKEIAKKVVGEENLHRVLPLSGEDCWKIFKTTYEEEGMTMSNDMKSLEKKITEKCCGLPLAAKMMAEIARKPK